MGLNFVLISFYTKKDLYSPMPSTLRCAQSCSSMVQRLDNFLIPHRFSIVVCPVYEDPADHESSPFDLPNVNPFTWSWLSTLNRVNTQVRKVRSPLSFFCFASLGEGTEIKIIYLFITVFDGSIRYHSCYEASIIVRSGLASGV